MPIVDGLSSTKMIRAFEKKSLEPPDTTRSHIRIPIIAVSASLVESQKETYVNAGFDGWILKPIDFKRLEKLLFGIVDGATREELLYVPGFWERGGFFEKAAAEGKQQGGAGNTGDAKSTSSPQPQPQPQPEQAIVADAKEGRIESDG